MSVTLENVGALDRLKARFQRLVNPDATPLMLAFELIIEDDNRKGVLAGTDKDGGYMLAVTYRPKVPKGLFILNPNAKDLGHLRNFAKPRTMRDLVFGGFGPMAAGLNNNLNSDQYRRLDGPPLAPRKQYSRVITNLRTGHAREGIKRWRAFGYWDEVVDREGRPFLHYHFEGAGRLPMRDLRGVRPEGMEKARRAARAWIIDVVRTYGG
jgi:hypothetical protein